MNGVLVSRSALLPAPSIVPSSGNVISRAVIVGNKARLVIPLYPGIAIGDQVNVQILTDGQWGFFSSATVTDVNTMIEFVLYDALFASPTTQATASYIVNNNDYSAQALYSVED
ncbi:hypothetical protein IB241_01190 [Pseudomonas sp. PDM05]|uniref:hypothetical protein n=1 Tax=Pseudomonas sp. PDM05 TaxID=2769301 RepID=UPI00178726E1|nr:hypothetical protein [Pseudomonas sp. PDM05]MBD9456292.1 hypothetical protein [Pseudomonas sp. PDM05]